MSSPQKLGKDDLRKARLKAMGLLDENSQQNGLRDPDMGSISAADTKMMSGLLASSHLPKDDLDRWFLQGFTFCDAPSYGLKQGHGGPCGVLATVQAEIIRQMIFGAPHSDGVLQPPQLVRSEVIALFASAVTEILGRASQNDKINIVCQKPIYLSSK